jgi:hypothetical protein
MVHLLVGAFLSRPRCCDADGSSIGQGRKAALIACEEYRIGRSDQRPDHPSGAHLILASGLGHDLKSLVAYLAYLPMAFKICGPSGPKIEAQMVNAIRTRVLRQATAASDEPKIDRLFWFRHRCRGATANAPLLVPSSRAVL